MSTAKSVSRREFLRWSLLASAGAMLAACSPAPAPAPAQPPATQAPAGATEAPKSADAKATEPPKVEAAPAQQAVELQFWSFALGLPADTWPHGKWEGEQAAKYTELHPEVKIQYQPLGWENWDKISLSIAAGTPPNVLLRTSVDHVLKAIEGNCALEIELPEEFKNDLPAGWWDGMEYLGKHYMIPFYWMGVGHAFNYSLIEEAGATDLLPKAPAYGPWTFEQYTELMRKCTFKRANGRQAWGKIIGLNVGTPLYLWNEQVQQWCWGSDTMAYKDGQWTCTFNDDKTISWLQWLYDLYAKDKVMPDPNGTVPNSWELYNQGDYLGGSAMVPGWTQEGMQVDPETLIITDTKLNQKYLCVQGPTGPGVEHPACWGGPLLDVNIMPFKVKDDSQIKPSVDFCFWMTDKDHEKWLSQFITPIRQSVLEGVKDPLLKWHIQYVYPYGRQRAEGSAGVALGATTNYVQVLQKLFLGMPAKQCADEYCQLFNNLDFPKS